jgi:hypothetical protein
MLLVTYDNDMFPSVKRQTGRVAVWRVRHDVCHYLSDPVSGIMKLGRVNEPGPLLGVGRQVGYDGRPLDAAGKE